MTVSASSVTSTVPTVDWLDPAALDRDPYPSYKRLREEAPVAWWPAVQKVLISSSTGCTFAENHPEVFSSNVAQAAMVRALGGRPLIRKDDPEHASERASMNKTLRPKQIMEIWTERFRANAEEYLGRMVDSSNGTADLNTAYAAPVAAKNLCDMLGLAEVAPLDLARWSIDFIAGQGNVLDRQDIWDRCDRSRSECDAALDEVLPRLRRFPDASITSMLLEGGMDEDRVRNNVKLTISGGMNEPQHMITSMVWLLERHPEQKAQVLEDTALWKNVFTEAVRYFSPIGMITRQTVSEVELEGVLIPAGSQVGMILASANRDAARFEEPDRFDIHRTAASNLAFGAGVHQCAGKWAAQKAIGEIAVPLLYERLPGLRQDPERAETWAGWVFRGLTSLPVTW
ncbi:cytochrome P450 [Arthrobacter sp. Marseille-P9274]|uniref:cytochrome P450 n=1 Tax=Arthrobacter sp. Marseille-P9274 TaxID=2866572 RepID=UPI0021C7C9A2|nr:cytochrome P450 [Arthrobacter sp. Marseille-P9274]